ncbi:MAG: ArsC family reductase [Burkholderiales bacterium]|nr:ArsC family reductase [Burkholderiales bacterium]
MKLYGIPNCDTVKKARAWLAAHGVECEFHDYKKQGVDAALLAKWMAKAGWDKVINRQGQTWRKLTEAEKAQVKDGASAIQLAQEKPSVIKRPAIEYKGKLILGFNETEYQNIFGEKS